MLFTAVLGQACYLEWWDRLWYSELLSSSAVDEVYSDSRECGEFGDE
jgi:hypothetical protein